MRFTALAALLALGSVVLPCSVLAKVLAEGKPVKGFYWQKIEKSDGKTSYLCRATGDSKIQKHEACSNAGAKQPK